MEATSGRGWHEEANKTRQDNSDAKEIGLLALEDRESSGRQEEASKTRQDNRDAKEIGLLALEDRESSDIRGSGPQRRQVKSQDGSTKKF